MLSSLYLLHLILHEPLVKGQQHGNGVLLQSDRDKNLDVCETSKFDWSSPL